MMRIIFIISIMICLYPVLGFGQDSTSVNVQILSNSDNKAWDRFSARFGGFFASYNSGVRYRSQQLGLGIQIDLEDALGIDATVFAYRGDLRYKIGKTKKQTLSLGYFQICRSAMKVLEEELEIGDEVFPIGTDVASIFNISILRTKYDYSFYQDSRVSIGASGGLYVLQVNLRVKADNQNEHVTKFVAPLPLIGLRTDFLITNNFYLKQNFEFLYLSFADFSGGILDLSVFLEHKSFDHFAFGLGVNSNRLSISLKNPDSAVDFYGDLEMEYTGVLLYAKYFF